MTAELDFAKTKGKLAIAEALSSGESSAMEQAKAGFVFDAGCAGMASAEAEAWFQAEQLRQLLASLDAPAPAKAPPDRLKIAAVVLTIILLGIVSWVIIRLAINTQPDGSGRAWLLNYGWILIFMVFPLFKVLYPLLYSGMDYVRQANIGAEVVREAVKRAEENRNWVWLCQRCEATYAYRGEDAAECGRCGNRLTKVRGMQL